MDPSIDYRLRGVEDRSTRNESAILAQAQTLARHEEDVVEGEKVLIVHTEQIAQLTKVVDKLNDTMTKVVWSLVGFSFTVAAAAVGVALTTGAGP